MNSITLAAGEELNPLIPHPVEIVLSLVVFGLLLFAVKKFVVPNFEKTFADRTAAIEGGLQAAETKQAEADAKLAELTRQLSEARHEAARIREEAREQGATIVA
ncbi:MAG TPA: F0F1 ATP synthase subunit B, partial [Nocardioidaceae bacterium]|nr:F0F1 ATP synthase subunit B [Nocardioidaceae bacterium]